MILIYFLYLCLDYYFFLLFKHCKHFYDRISYALDNSIDWSYISGFVKNVNLSKIYIFFVKKYGFI